MILFSMSINDPNIAGSYLWRGILSFARLDGNGSKPGCLLMIHPPSFGPRSRDLYRRVIISPGLFN